MGYFMGDDRPPTNTSSSSVASHRTTSKLAKVLNETIETKALESPVYTNSHPWGVFFTVLGTVLLDFDADACQSPSRAYLLDVTIPGKLMDFSSTQN